MNFCQIKKLFNCKFYFKIPSKKKFVIFDRAGSQYIKKYLPLNSYFILPTRLESLNLFVAIKMLVKLKYSRKSYIYEYIKILNPKAIITFIDNSIFFYQLKFKNIKKIAIQNGLRTMHPKDFFFNLKKKKIHNLNCDYIFTQNKPIISQYKKYIKSKFLILGSIRSNNSKINVKEKKFDLVYISSFRVFSYHQIYKNYSVKDWQNKEIILLKFAERYCEENNKKLTILGSSILDAKKELKFYKKNLKIKFKFVKRSPSRNTYKLVDQSKVLFGIDSSLQSESLARGAKVAFFSYRGKEFPFNSRKFGWPKNYPNSGEFWDNKAQYENFKKVIDYLYKVKRSEWLNICEFHKINIMNFDLYNKSFKRFILKI